MKIKTIEVFSFDELDEKTQNKVIQELHDCNVDHNDWHESTIENLVSDLEENGFENAQISFSGFCSQGDGASFDADINVEKFCSDKRILRIAQTHCHFRIETNSYANHYSHERTRYVEYDGLDSRYVHICNALSELSAEIERERYRLSKLIYRTLEKEYSYLTSREQVIETIKTNEWTFTANGKMENI